MLSMRKQSLNSFTLDRGFLHLHRLSSGVADSLAFADPLESVIPERGRCETDEAPISTPPEAARVQGLGRFLSPARG